MTKLFSESLFAGGRLQDVAGVAAREVADDLGDRRFGCLCAARMFHRFSVNFEHSQ